MNINNRKISNADIVGLGEVPTPETAMVVAAPFSPATSVVAPFPLAAVVVAGSIVASEVAAAPVVFAGTS